MANEDNKVKEQSSVDVSNVDNPSKEENNELKGMTAEQQKAYLEYEKSAKNFEELQGASAKEIDMKDKSKKTFFGSVKNVFNKHFYKIEKCPEKKEIALKSESSQSKKIVSLDHKTLVVAVLVLVFIMGGSLIWGLSKESSMKASKEETKTSSNLSKDAVTGNHLVNVPRDYTSLAEEESKRKAEADKKRNRDFLHPEKTSDVMRAPVKAPEVPSYEPAKTTVPSKIRDRHFREYENYLELQQKAKESPIRFELDK